MNICIPITRDNGIQSPVSLHFGSAPLFMVVDTESGSLPGHHERQPPP